MTRRTAAGLLLLLLLPAAAEEAQLPKPPSKAEILKAFRAYTLMTPEERSSAARPWAGLPPLSKAETKAWRQSLWEAQVQALKAWKQKQAGDKPAKPGGVETVRFGDQDMRYVARTCGNKPAKGWPLYLNFHGGGANTPMNDSGWSTAQGHYAVRDAIHLCPRSPRDDLEVGWCAPSMHGLLDRILKEAFALRDVDPNRVYIMGYSMGAYGNLHLGPLMADHWAAAAASAGAGYPDSSPPFNLRNTPFMIQIGTDDRGRYAGAKRYADALKECRAADPEGYVLEYREHKGRAHDIPDADAPAWLAKWVRDPIPRKVAAQKYAADIERLYWVGLEWPNQKVTAQRDGNTFRVSTDGGGQVTLYLDDRMADLDKPVKVMSGDAECFNGPAPRSLETLAETLADRGDPELVFSARLSVAVR